MRNIISVIFLSIAILLSLTACGSKAQEDLGNEYIPEIDYPLMYEASIDGLYIAESETGYYFISGHFLYYADKTTMEAIPLCNKPDCKHMDEPDDKKVYYCNAYLGNGCALPYIQLYENELYTIEGFNSTLKKLQTSLVKISADGSKRERLMEVPDNAVYAIHRGYLYTANNLTGTISKVPLNKPDSEPELLFESRLNSSSFYLFLKGNYMIIQNWGTIEEDKSYREQLFTHNILTGETVEILGNEEDPDIYAVQYNSNDDKLIYSKHPHSYTINDPIIDENIIYVNDLNGENETVFKDFREKTDKFAVRIYFDGTYYYEEWINYMLPEEEIKGRQFNVYNENFELLYQGNSDWLPLNYRIAYGSGQHIFFTYKDKEIGEYVIDYVDKSMLAQGIFEVHRLMDETPRPPIGW